MQQLLKKRGVQQNGHSLHNLMKGCTTSKETPDFDATGRLQKSRTFIFGFGDRHSTIELTTCILIPFASQVLVIGEVVTTKGNNWCWQWDSNSHDIAITRFWVWRVYQFHHINTYKKQGVSKAYFRLFYPCLLYRCVSPIHLSHKFFLKSYTHLSWLPTGWERWTCTTLYPQQFSLYRSVLQQGQRGYEPRPLFYFAYLPV